MHVVVRGEFRSLLDYIVQLPWGVSTLLDNNFYSDFPQVLPARRRAFDNIVSKMSSVQRRPTIRILQTLDSLWDKEVAFAQSVTWSRKRLYLAYIYIQCKLIGVQIDHKHQYMSSSFPAYIYANLTIVDRIDPNESISMDSKHSSNNALKNTHFLAFQASGSKQSFRSWVYGVHGPLAGTVCAFTQPNQPNCEDCSSTVLEFGVRPALLSQWCRVCGPQHVGAVHNVVTKCEDCQEQSAFYGLVDDCIRRWCFECAIGHSGAIDVFSTWCEDCCSRRANFGKREDTGMMKRWCVECSQLHIGAIDVVNVRCEECNIKPPVYGIGSVGVPRWCVPCGRSRITSVRIPVPRCNSCVMEKATYGVIGKADRRWCATCAPKYGLILDLENTRCEDCRQLFPTFGYQIQEKKRWCKKCSLCHPGSVLIQKLKCQDCKVRYASFCDPNTNQKAWCVRCACNHIGAMDTISAKVIVAGHHRASDCNRSTVHDQPQSCTETISNDMLYVDLSSITSPVLLTSNESKAALLAKFPHPSGCVNSADLNLVEYLLPKNFTRRGGYKPTLQRRWLSDACIQQVRNVSFRSTILHKCSCGIRLLRCKRSVQIVL